MNDFWNILQQMNYYFLTYWYVWIPCIIGAFVFGWYWDKKHEQFEAQKQHKYIISIRKKDGSVKRRKFLTNLKEFYIYENIKHPVLSRRPEIEPEENFYHIQPSTIFEIFKEGFEPLYNNWFTNRLPLRLFYKHRGWNWYKKFIVHFDEGEPEVLQEGITLSSGTPFSINIGSKKETITAVDIKVLVDTSFIRSALSEQFKTPLGAFMKRFGIIIIISCVAGIIVYLFMTGQIKSPW